MIQLTPHMRILVAMESVDFRSGIDGLVGICKYKLQKNPMDGTLFVFHNKKRTGFKIIVYDGSGFWMIQKRWSQGKIHWWKNEKGECCQDVNAEELLGLIWNGDPRDFKSKEKWKKIM